MKKSGFTLVELSIVIVIIGLLVGGVLGANSLIDSSKRQAQIKQFNDFSTALNAFKLEYDAMPGDFDEASQYWPGATDGNGDKQIDGVEYWHSWNHLSEAQVLPNYYNTSPQCANNSCPTSKIGSGGLVNMYEYKKYLYYTIAGDMKGECDFGVQVLDVEDVYYIDKKMDDSKATSGKIVATVFLIDEYDSNCDDAEDFIYSGDDYVLSSENLGVLVYKIKN